MKIALLCHLHHPLRTPYAGGLERHTVCLARELMTRGHDLTVFALPGSAADLPIHPIDLASFGGPRDVWHATAVSRQREAAYHHICDYIITEGFDLVHNNCLNRVPMLRAHELGAPMVQVMHTPVSRELAAGALAAKRHRAVRFISVSEVNRREWAPHVGECTMIPNGIDVREWRFSPLARDGEVVFVGRIVEDKGVHLAMDAARLAAKHISVAGPICDRDFFDREIAPRLGPHATYAGHLRPAELAVVMGEAECLVFSSLWAEPFGYVLAESLACGTPVAGFDVGASREVLSDETAVLVEVANVERLAGAIRAARRLSRVKCRAYAETKFSFAAMVDAYEQVYREAVAGYVVADGATVA